MYLWTRFPIIRLSICLIVGILLYEKYPIVWVDFGWGPLLLVMCLALFNYRFVRIWQLQGAVYILLMGYLGGGLAYLSEPTHQLSHYVNAGKASGFRGIIVSDESEREHYYRYELELTMCRVGDSLLPVSGKVYLYVRKAEKKTPFIYGDVVFCNKGYFDVPGPKNPDEFDYRHYLQLQGIFAHAFVSSEDIKIIGHDPPDQMFNLAYTIRGYCKSEIQTFVKTEREQAVLIALLLGVKDYLDEDIRETYATAGAMHVLAVSGLHVGIIYAMLVWVLGRWRRTRMGRYGFVVVALAAVWMYALITGFSPSVLRSAIMLSLVIVSEATRRSSNVYNALGIAAFVLIVYDPNTIYSVGFQLSFLAVLGIVIIYPLIHRKWYFSGRLANYIWSITCISIAAQLATFPLTLLYFHQMPTYFLVSNLVVIPAANVLLIAGIAMLALGSVVPVIGGGIGFLLGYFLYAMNEVLTWLTVLPYSLMNWLSVDRLEVFLIYLILGFILLLCVRYRFSDLVSAFIMVLLLFSRIYYQQYKQHRQHAIVVYKLDGVTAIDLIKGNQALLLIERSEHQSMDLVAYQINPHRLAIGLPPVSESFQYFDASELVFSTPFFDLVEWEGVRILMPKDASKNHLQEQLTSDIILFRSADAVCLDQMSCDQVILGNNFSYYELQKTVKDLRALHLPVHALAIDGYKEIDLNEPKRGHGEWSQKDG